MSKLDDLINKLCPDGVEFRTVEDCIVSLKTGLNPRQNFKLNVENATCPYITGKDIFNSKINITERTDKITNEAVKIINKRACLEVGNLLFASTGTGTVGRMAIIKEYSDNWNVSETLYSLKPKNFITSKYLMYFLYTNEAKNQFEPKISKGSVPHLKVGDLLNVKLPVPPLEIQNEIVRILDKFTELEEKLKEELRAELVARRKQYEYYRDSLLTFDDSVEWKFLGDIATVDRGGSFQKTDFKEAGKPCIHYGQMYTHFRTYADKTLTFLSDEVFNKSRIANPNDIVMAVTSENIEDVCKCVAWVGNEDIAVSGHTAIIRHKQNAKYLAYFFQSKAFYKEKVKLAHGTKVIEVTPSKLCDIKIPVPSIEEQERIVSFLDRFETLCNDITSRLPAEIEARHKQYEYYRDKLLNFKRKEA